MGSGGKGAGDEHIHAVCNWQEAAAYMSLSRRWCSGQPSSPAAGALLSGLPVETQVSSLHVYIPI